MSSPQRADAATRVLQAPTITSLPDAATGSVMVSGSHGGLYPGYCSAKAGLRAVILNDAGVGKDDAGIGSLAWLEPYGIGAATVSNLTCRIGDPRDMLSRGLVSHANAIAQAAGVCIGMACALAADLLRQVVHRITIPAALGEARGEIVTGHAGRRILLLDSAALVTPADAGHIVVTGSHGGLVGGVPAMALRTDGFAAVFNDAGIGIDDAGVTRLPALDQRGIAAVTVAAGSARIGEAASTYHDGIISCVNVSAAQIGARVGEPLAPLLQRWARS